MTAQDLEPTDTVATAVAPGRAEPAALSRRAGLRAGRAGQRLALGALVGLTLLYGAGFAWLAVQRHAADGSHAEDLGFTDQVIWNFLRGQWFRMTLYQGATWNTDVDLARLARPDSLLAFHVEPMLLAFVPLYALGGGATLLLILQAFGFALGAIPAFRLGEHVSTSRLGGVAVALIYLLSPFGQWALLSDFHTATLAAPLLVLAFERWFVAQRHWQAVVCAALALTAREDVVPAVIVLGLVFAATERGRPRAAALVLTGLGLAWAVLALLTLDHYSGGVSPFGVRYGPALSNLPASLLSSLSRPEVLALAGVLLGSGGWLGLLAPLALLPALPNIAIDALSSSPWMATGTAHYGILLLPFVVIGATLALGTLRRWPHLLRGAGVLLIGIASLTYLGAGAGPVGADFAPATVTWHARYADRLAASLPRTLGVSASTSLVPHLSHRPRVYVFPSIQDADLVFLDVTATPAPTSVGDVALRVRTLLADGWSVDLADDGLLLLSRPGVTFPPPDAPSPSAGARPLADPLDLGTAFFGFARAEPSPPLASFLDGRLELLDERVLPATDGAVEPDGPRGVVHTVWRATLPVTTDVQPHVLLDLDDGEQLRLTESPTLWWLPSSAWPAGQPIAVDFAGVPLRHLVAWQVELETANGT
jgi:uncharacterized membrane protein